MSDQTTYRDQINHGKGTEESSQLTDNEYSFLKKGGEIRIEDALQENKTLVGIEKRVFTARELREQPIEADIALFDPILPKVGLAALVGGSDTGKSMLLRQAAYKLVGQCQTFLGFAIRATHNRALCILTEDDPPAIKHLMSFQANDIPSDLLENLQFIFSPEDALKEADDHLTTIPCDLVIVDSWGDASGIDPKDNGKVRAVLNEWHKLAIKHQCLIIFLHHTGKSTDAKAPSKHNTIGAQSFEAKVRCLIELRKDSNDDSLRHFCIVKANGLPSSYKNESFVLEFDQDNFKFTNTGGRRAFEELASLEFKSKGPTDTEKYELVCALVKSGKTLEQIAPLVGFSSKGSVSKLIARMKDKETPF